LEIIGYPKLTSGASSDHSLGDGDAFGVCGLPCFAIRLIRVCICLSEESRTFTSWLNNVCGSGGVSVGACGCVEMSGRNMLSGMFFVPRAFGKIVTFGVGCICVPFTL